MNILEIQKKKEQLRNQAKAQIAELDALEKQLERIEREKAAEKLKKNYENNRDSLAAILFKLHAKDFVDFDLSQLKSDVVAILNPEPSATKAPGSKKTKSAKVIPENEPAPVETSGLDIEPPEETEEPKNHLAY